MKRFFSNTVILLAASLSIVSCDFVRMVAGRPTSGEIEEKRMEMKNAEIQMKQEKEAFLASVKKAGADSLEAVNSIARDNILMINASKLVSDSQESLPSKYYIILGSFKDPANADKLVARVSAEGITAERIRLKSGSTAVGIMPSDNISGAYSALNEAKKHDFCPPEAWILINEK